MANINGNINNNKFFNENTTFYNPTADNLNKLEKLNKLEQKNHNNINNNSDNQSNNINNKNNNELGQMDDLFNSAYNIPQNQKP